jgi:hypothetical protein
MNGGEITFSRAPPIFFSRAMKGGDIRPFSEGPNGFGKLITCSLRDLIDLPPSCVEENTAHHPAQVLGRRKPVVPQMDRFLDKLLYI